MVAALAAELRLEEPFRTLGETFTTGQLPSLRALDALVPARPAARVAAQIAFRTGATIAVVAAEKIRGTHRAHISCLIFSRFATSDELTHRHTWCGIRRSAAANPSCRRYSSCATRTGCRCADTWHRRPPPCSSPRRTRSCTARPGAAGSRRRSGTRSPSARYRFRTSSGTGGSGRFQSIPLEMGREAGNN